MTTYTFLVWGSKPEPYETIFYSDGKNITATCSCEAGQYGQYCKHRIAILNGDDSKIVSNKKELPQLLMAFKGTPLDLKMREIKIAEQEFEVAKRKLDFAKKEFSNMLCSH